MNQTKFMALALLFIIIGNIFACFYEPPIEEVCIFIDEGVEKIWTFGKNEKIEMLCATFLFVILIWIISMVYRKKEEPKEGDNEKVPYKIQYIF